MDLNKICNATDLLCQYIEKEDYRGYDPYDGLTSPFFKLPFLNKNKFIRFYSQQVVKRFPVNLRPLLFIKKGYNPVTLGLCIQGYTNLLSVYPEQEKILLSKINFLIDELIRFIPKGFHGACWGYDFDWEARYTKIPAYQPTIVATGFITNALFLFYKKTGNQKAFELCKSSCDFILNDINRTEDQNGNFAFSYSPFDKQVVFNASMKGVRALSQVYSLTKENNLKDFSKKAVDFVMQYQKPDGSWIYSTSKVGTWVDNFHTGYVIDCLDEYIKYTGDAFYQSHLEKAYQFYKTNFFEQNRIPKYYDKNIYPIDCTSAGQSLLTLSRFNDIELAAHVAEWMIDNMQAADGHFYYTKFKSYTVKTSMMRWANAWMLAGLTAILSGLKTD